MSVTLSSRQFNQQVSRVKQIACREPVFITSRGKPAHVLLSYEDYLRLAGQQEKIADLLAMPGAEDIELDIRRSREVPREAGLF
jgi:prevent-host-death family protein